MARFNNITRTETFIILEGDNNLKVVLPTASTILVDDESGAISVKTTSSRKTYGYVLK